MFSVKFAIPQSCRLRQIRAAANSGRGAKILKYSVPRMHYVMQCIITFSIGDIIPRRVAAPRIRVGWWT